jgi:hypothetical protein
MGAVPHVLAPDKAEDFSLVLGGPLYQLLARSTPGTPALRKVMWRMAIIVGIAWIPLLALTVLSSHFSGGVPVAFRYDFEVQARLLFALPMLILAEVVVHTRMRSITAQFLEREIIGEQARAGFDNAVASALKLRNSVTAEIVLLVLVCLAGPVVWRAALSLNSDTWYATRTPSGAACTPAGFWYQFVCVPIFQFILLRWYYRIFIWCRFLVQASRLDLDLVPIHPDRCAGLGFLGNTAYAFAPVAMAHSGLVAGFIANHVVHEQAPLSDYRLEHKAHPHKLQPIVLGPLCVFAPKLIAARLVGLRTYGRLASSYVLGFAAKWTGGKPVDEPLVGSSDIQSLADLDNSFRIVRETKIVPFGKETVIGVLVATAIPLAPLALIKFSPQEIIERLIKVLL